MRPPRRLLVAAAPFRATLSAGAVAAALGRGLLDAGLPPADLCPLEGASGDPRAELDAVGFDARMRASWALLVAVPGLREHTLGGSLAFELATRARQAGVPAYAVTAENRLSAFDARILDLQAILVAPALARGLRAAGAELGAALSADSPGTRT